MVRPVLKPADVINVTFQVDLKALSAVVTEPKKCIFLGFTAFANMTIK